MVNSRPVWTTQFQDRLDYVTKPCLGTNQEQNWGDSLVGKCSLWKQGEWSLDPQPPCKLRGWLACQSVIPARGVGRCLPQPHWLPSLAESSRSRFSKRLFQKLRRKAFEEGLTLTSGLHAHTWVSAPTNPTHTPQIKKKQR